MRRSDGTCQWGVVASGHGFHPPRDRLRRASGPPTSPPPRPSSRRSSAGATDYGPEYAGIQAPDGDGEVGGIDATTAPRDGGPLVLLYSDDLGATLEAVVNGGGTVTAAPYAFPGGRRFHFTEPGGSTLSVWAAEKSDPA